MTKAKLPTITELVERHLNALRFEAAKIGDISVEFSRQSVEPFGYDYGQDIAITVRKLRERNLTEEEKIEYVCGDPRFAKYCFAPVGELEKVLVYLTGRDSLYFVSGIYFEAGYRPIRLTERRLTPEGQIHKQPYWKQVALKNCQRIQFTDIINPRFEAR